MSKIEWTDTTWNPVTGCNKISTGCKFCYAEAMHKRLQGMGQPKYQQDFLKGPVLQHQTLNEPFSWKKHRMVFVCSMSDLFHQYVPFDFIDKVFAVMALNPQHTFQILTKRTDRMARYFSLARKFHVRQKMALLNAENVDSTPWPLPNVWLGTSVENQEQADHRIPLLLQVPASIRFLSCEPLIGPVDLENVRNETGSWGLFYKDMAHINWVIVGGESGRGDRKMDVNWVRSLKQQCEGNHAAFFFKQWGRLRNNPNQNDPTIDTDHPQHAKGGCQLDGKVYHQLPKTTTVQQIQP